MATTIALGCAFLGNKYIEWSHEIAQGNYPNSDHLINGPHAQTIFYGLYYTLTGLHGLHVLIGILVIATCLFLTVKGTINSSRITILENTGLFWHLVDIIWIFLFPLLYLIP
jgi:cytochrome c oxidase subunit 3